MSKLKRKKTPADASRQDPQPTTKKTNESLQESCSKTSGGSSSADGGLWWDRPGLTAEERIWAVTLKALCPPLQTPAGEGLPALPPPSSAKAPVEAAGDWRWNHPDPDVSEVPDLPPPSFLIRPPPVKDPTSYLPAVRDPAESGPTVSTAQEPSASPERESVCDLQTTKPGAEASGSEPGTSKSGIRRSGFDLKKSPGSELRTTSEPGGSGSELRTTSEPGGSGSELRTTLEPEGTGSEIRPTSKPGTSGSELRTTSEPGGSGSELRTTAEPGGSGLQSDTSPGSQGCKLECCPMCLMPFPAGFSQMECDGHLAQCLSEMNEDIVW